MDWKKESEMFGQMAEYYDKFRPSYPKDIIDTLLEQTNLSRGSKLLEIGAGSGKATELFANKGFDILCVEPGADLVAAGNAKFQDENFKFVQARFEEYDTYAKEYDAIFAAQAFHWVPQPIGYQKCAYALKDDGYLALLWNMYITYDNDLDNELLAISNKYGGFADFLSEDACAERIHTITAEIEDSGLFAKPIVFRSNWKQQYTADEFYGFMLTGNRFVQKTDEDKLSAYEQIKRLAEKHKGIIQRPYLCVLYVAQKL